MDEEYIAELGNQIAELKHWKLKVEGNLVYPQVQQQQERNALRSMEDAREELEYLLKGRRRSSILATALVAGALAQIPVMYFWSFLMGLLTCVILLGLGFFIWYTAPTRSAILNARSHAKTTAYDYEDMVWRNV